MLTKIEKISTSSALAIKIIEAENGEIPHFLSFREKLSMANISHHEKRSEWISSRLAIFEALNCLSIDYPGFYKDEHGKNLSMTGEGFVSLTHTYGYAAAIYHKECPVGIDLEPVREKILRIGPRFLAKEELDFLEDDAYHYTLAWSAKESIFKCQGRRGVSFRDNIYLEPFGKDSKVIFGNIHGLEGYNHRFRVEVSKLKDLVLTYTTW